MGDTEVLQIDACISEQYRNLCQSARFIRDIDKELILHTDNTACIVRD